MCNTNMFCFQCQETFKNEGCQISGICGKKPTTASLQDLLIYITKGVANYSQALRQVGSPLIDTHVNQYFIHSLFITITNANFDDQEILHEIQKGLELRESLKAESKKLGLTSKFENHTLANWYFTKEADLLNFSKTVGVLRTKNEDIRSLRELLTYGLKGMAAYTEHALHLGKTDDSIFIFLEKTLLATEDDALEVSDLIALVLECGKFGVSAMALLDHANTSTFGNPEITKVNIGVGTRPGILISGHDLHDIKQLLEQSKDSGVDIYTHSEMLPAHYYPELKKYSHLYGNYGNAWWKQREEFENFHGPIVFTTNCIVPPKKGYNYEGKVFTSNATGFPDWKKIPVREDGIKDFSEVIEMAKTCQAPKAIEEGEIIGGFAHNQVFALADQVVEAVKSGAIKKFVVMGGCDGRHKERDYYGDFAKALPQDTVILTAGCAKYRYNKMNLGDIGGIPRVLDAGQCNDSYSLAIIALKLKEVFALEDINQLPIIYNIAWYEQKAVIVLLALLYLGIKNIHLGPTLPAFLSANVAKVLVENFGIAGIGTVEEDMKKFFEM